ncbi:proprotein convertase subtilisin/kexin type 5 isoform X1 [Solea senegalensis]|uniref:Proprotein convertase subtilisin/kexin type 5 isoform X1 n=1 Tax=Solea senegalensis TaxID=28829 RepID=A0AAV6QHM7_SOLSE|nr:proprotein convertase subtilisin/kexin type 5b isoform X2 [Solea senegalensis]KAG7490700.1 proprotein convertase subtilisin/kexin type 5 isoform X1 [Solea senegalensis]
MVRNAAWRRSLLCVLALSLSFASSPCKARIYTNHWAVRIAGGPEVAERIAEKYGYRNMGQIGDLKDHYHFFHSRTIKRSTLSSQGRHSFISMEPKVEWIQQQVVKRRIKRDYKQSPPLSLSSPAYSSQAQTNIFYTDAKWSSMWYIHCNDDVHNCQSDMNIMGAWKRGYTGKDVVVTILDDGIERNHPDLFQNYDPQASFDVNGNDVDPMPRYDATNENKHGTRCAGEVAAAANNSHCIVGIAYNARIGGVRMLDGDVTDMVEAKSLSLHPQHIDIYSASWGPDDDGKTVDGPASLARTAFENGIRMGRKGRGSIFVWASGNGGRSRDHCSCDGYTNSIYTISISSTAESGRKPWYLEECSSTLTTTYSSGENYDRKIITTDLRHRCTDSHTGTSASAPMAAAIVALALEANPLLTWRDVQHIIVKTSRAGHLSAPDWKTNAAGYNVSHLYGFGLMDAEAMVKEAERWRQVPSQHVCVESADRQIRTIRPDHVVRSVYKATGCTDNPNHHVIYLEHVVVRITITHPRRGDLSINLTSPSGTKSQLLANRLFDHSMEGFKNWEFMTTHCWGEKAAGDWVLEIYDSPSQLRSQKVPGKLKEWSLVLYGTSVNPYSSLRNDKPRSAETVTPTDEEFTEEYSGPCDSECNENGCEGPGPHHCINCLHYFLKFKNNTRMCVSECPSGFFRDDRKRCKKCSSLCETCVGSRSDQCTTCRSGFHLNEGSNTCVASCADSFYLDRDSNICRRCPEDCKKCNTSNICTECKPGMSLQGNKCQMTCDPGTYYNAHRRMCEPCHRACASCAGTGIEACTKCAEGYLLEDWRCVSTCSTGYYLSEQTSDNGKVQRSCKKCDHSCYECLLPGERNCSSCVSGYNLEGGACVVSTICKDGEYLSYGKCHLCDVTCLRCSGPEQEACTSCPDTRLFDDGRCSIRCQTGRYAQGRQCESCHHSCHECVDEGPNNCTSCDRDKFGVARYFFQGQCRDVCPEGFFHSTRSRCEPCPAECIICTAENQCVHCSPGHKPRNGQCVPLECSEGEVAEDEDCLHCDEGCKQCERKDSGEQGQETVCLKCEDGYYLLGTDCHQTCPDRTYSLNSAMVCAPCEDRKCVVCEQSQCYWCEDEFYTFGGECVDHCKEGFFVDEESRECESCHRSCRTCGGPQYDDCDSCEKGFTLDNGECVEGKTLPCSEGHFRNIKDECEQCHSTCRSCSAAEKDDCRSCHSGTFLTAQQTCVPHCPLGTFANKVSNQCQDCSKGCVTCQDAQQCLRCRSGLYLQNGLCVTQCQRGFHQDGNCQPCAPECASCQQSAAHCLSCEEHYFLLDHSCKSRCPDGYFTTDRECRSCPAHCSECNEDGLCKKCAEYYFLQEGKCVDDCPQGYFASEKQQECVHCHSECATCDGPGIDDCLVCSNVKAVRYNGECLAKCLDHTYYDGRTNECRDCDRSCLTCSGPDPSSCLSCDTNRRKDASGHCMRVTQCPPQSYTDQSGNCQQCHKLCNLCSGPGKNNCLNCNKPHFLLNGTCVEQCPVGYYAEDEGERVCERCHFSCKSCAGHHSLQCVTCKTGFFKQGSSCVESCSESHFGDTETMVCEHCDPSCSQCSGPGNRNCLSCRRDYVYVRQWGQCLQSCPSNFYLDKRFMTCHRCHSTCKTCRDKGALACLSCYDSYAFRGGICMSECLIGFYGTSQSDSQSDEPECRPCDSSCMDCRGPSMWNCTVCHALQILSDDGRCLSCCGDQNGHDDKPIPWECCDCEASLDECVMGVNFVLEKAEPESSAIRLFVTVCVLLVILGGGGLFLFLNARSKSLTLSAKAKAGGYKKLDTNGSVPAQFSTSSLGEYSDRILDCKEDDEEEEDDIVHMGKDGTVYRKFKYGLLDEDDIELEYDDESYSYI